MNGVLDMLFGTAPIRWIQDFFGLGHPVPFRILSLLGDTWGIVLVVGVGFWIFGRRTLHALVGIVVVGAATKLLLTNIFSMSRPDGHAIIVYDRLELGSFPSGHVYAAVGPWGLLYALRHVPLAAPVLMAVLVGLGRLYLGAHFLADVLAGALFGAALVWIYVKLWPTASRWLSRRGSPFHLALAAVVTGGTLLTMLMTEAHPRRYEIYGILIAAAIGLPIERRWLRYEPRPGSWRVDAGKIVLGVIVLATFLMWDRSQPEGALLLGTLTAGLATLWALLGAPALFVVLGMAGRGAAGDHRAVAADPSHEAAGSR